MEGERSGAGAGGADRSVDASARLAGGHEAMTRIEGGDPRHLAGEYASKVLEAQAKAWGAPLLNHLTYARRPSIFRGVRGRWTVLERSGLTDNKLVTLVNRRVASLHDCEL